MAKIPKELSISEQIVWLKGHSQGLKDAQKIYGKPMKPKKYWK